jgi:hypothetical protein
VRVVWMGTRDLDRHTMERPSEAWRLWLGLALSIVGVVMGLLSIRSDMMLPILASAVLVLLTGLIHFSLWSKVRHRWL